MLTFFEKSPTELRNQRPCAGHGRIIQSAADYHFAWKTEERAAADNRPRSASRMVVPLYGDQSQKARNMAIYGQVDRKSSGLNNLPGKRIVANRDDHFAERWRLQYPGYALDQIAARGEEFASLALLVTCSEPRLKSPASTTTAALSEQGLLVSWHRIQSPRPTFANATAGRSLV